MKKCFRCGDLKELDSFYKHPQMPDGTVNKCKECNKADVRANRKSKVDYYRGYDRSRGSRQSYSYTKEYRERFPKKYRAHSLLNSAIRCGRMKKEVVCSMCSSDSSVHAHHDDYAYPLSVRWLCAVCHKRWHDENGEGKNAS